MRRVEGIYDAPLRKEITALHAGDFVRLTFLTGLPPSAGEMLLVRITSITANAFRGKLSNRPTLNGLAKLQIGSAVKFTKDHIHSIPKERPYAR